MFGLSFLSGITSQVLILVVTLAVGFSTGYYTKAQFFKADLVDQIADARKGDANAVANAQATDRTIEAVQLKSSTAVSSIRAEAKRRRAVAQAVRAAEPSNQGSGELIGEGLRPSIDVAGRRVSDNLSIADVRLFNLAVDGKFDRATLPSDAAGEAPSQVTRAYFYDHTLQVVEQYLDLATSHDALVGYVEGLQKQQRQTLGAE